MSIEPCSFYDFPDIIAAVKSKIRRVAASGETIDYLTFVPDGEPSLDSNLGNEIDDLRETGIKIAIISNGSLLWNENVRQNLLKADLVSIKVDAISENIWRRVDRPHKSLDYNKVFQGIVEFVKLFKNILVTETMLIKGINDSQTEIIKLSEFLATLNPQTCYIAIPTRPPAVSLEPADESTINMVYHKFQENLLKVEYLIGYEGNAFASTGIIHEDLLSITSVHPMREDAVKELLQKTGSNWQIVQQMLEKYEIIELKYNGYKYYLRSFSAKT